MAAHVEIAVREAAHGAGGRVGLVRDLADDLHTSIVQASGSPRIAAAYDALSGELRLVLVQLRPVWTLERMADDHLNLVRDLERKGADVLRAHIRESTEALVEQARG